MSLMLIIIILILVFGGGGGYYGYRRWGVPGLGGILGLVLTIIIGMWLLGLFGIH